MARPGVTYAEVVEAASHLVGQNKNPTIEQIRLLLGRGSSNTILNHVKQWRKTQNNSNLLAAKENIPPELVALLKGLWERVIEQAELKVTNLQVSYEKNISDLKQELEKYKSNNQRWQQLFNQWQQEKTQLVNDKLALEEGIISLKKDKNDLQTNEALFVKQLQEKQERIAELHRLHAQVQANLEHYRESVREQRLIEQQQFSQQQQTLQIEVNSCKENLLKLQEKLSVSEQQYQLLQQNHTQLSASYKELERQSKILQQQLAEEEKLKNEHYQAHIHWQQQYVETNKKVELHSAKVIDVQAEIKILSYQLLETKQALSNAEDQIKLLSHDKWILAQEKAQLEGEIKQMHKIVKTN